MLLLLFIVHCFAIFKQKSVFNIPHIIRTVIFFSEWHLWSCNFTSGFWETLPYQNQQGKWDRQFITMDSSPRNGATESERVFQWWFDSNSHRTPAEHAWHANWQSLHFLICYLFHMLALYMQREFVYRSTFECRDPLHPYRVMILHDVHVLFGTSSAAFIADIFLPNRGCCMVAKKLAV